MRGSAARRRLGSDSTCRTADAHHGAPVEDLVGSVSSRSQSPPARGFEDADFRADPYPFYRRLLAEAPVSTEPTYGFVMVARHADIAALLRDPRLSSDDRKSDGYDALLAAGALGAEQQALLGDRSFLRRDPPDHTRLRRLASKVFTPARVTAFRPQVQRIVDEAVSAAASRARMDLIAELAYPLPMSTISRLLGVPAEDHVRIKSASRAQLCCSFEASGVVPGAGQARNCMVQSELAEYFEDLIARRRREPRDEVLSALIAAEEQGDQLTTEEVNATARLLLVGGHETTVSLIANGMLALLRHLTNSACCAGARPWRVRRWRRSCATTRGSSSCSGPHSTTSRSAATASPAAAPSSCGWVRATGTASASPTPSASTSRARTPTTWPSGPAPTTAWARRSPACRGDRAGDPGSPPGRSPAGGGPADLQ